jgi:hypothetical protein
MMQTVREFMRIAVFGVLALALNCTTPPPPVSTSPPPTGAVPTVATSASPAAVCPPVRQISLGAISGRLSYPSEFIPALVVFAIRADDGGTYRLLHTQRVPPGSPSYTMAAVEPGVYTVVAFVEGQGSALAGAYTAAAACGLGAGCTDHSLLRVTVRAGATVTGIDVTDWYAGPGAFPSRPAGSEPFRPGDNVRLCNPYADSANVRASAGLGFPVRRVLDNGTAVAVRDGPLPADGYDWYEINIAGDQLASGWVVGYALRR